jgi:transposase
VLTARLISLRAVDCSREASTIAVMSPLIVCTWEAISCSAVKTIRRHRHGLIAMRERDLQRIDVLSKAVGGRMTTLSAAHMLDLSEHQVRWPLERIWTGGAASIRHKAIGRPSNNRISDGARDYAITLVRERYADFGPTLATERLAERDGLRVSRETVRKWMAEAGLWLSRKQWRTFHQPRLRREAYGELVQIDGSEHRWFEDRGPPCSLLVFVDDATGKLMQLRFVRSESAPTISRRWSSISTVTARRLPFIRTCIRCSGWRRRMPQVARA